MLAAHEIDQLRAARHADPFSVLGVHQDERQRFWLRAFLPGAVQLTVLEARTGASLAVLDPRHEDGFFEGLLSVTTRPDYRLQVAWADGQRSIVDDPYRFAPVLGDMDVWLMAEGSHLRPYEALGAIQRLMEGVAGTSFA